jgi:hypothetical protein
MLSYTFIERPFADLLFAGSPTGID